jgi:outer membrane lipoprotein
MITRFHYYLMVLLAMALSACAITPPFSEETLHGVNRTLAAEQAVKDDTRDVQVLWGGIIIGAENKPNRTEITVLYYPLDSSQQPDVDKPAQNRFIVRHAGYLETMVYAPGREITVIGTLQGVEEGKVGDASYRFPVLKADKIYLWPLDENSKVHFGVGVGVGVHM